MIHSLINQFRLTAATTEKEVTTGDTLLVRNFLCLIELLDIILTDRSSKTSNNSLLSTETDSDKIELNNLFEIIICYFKCDKLRTTVFNTERSKLWHATNLVVLKFAKYIQKHLQRYLITCEDINVQSDSPIITASSTGNDGLIRNYVEMIFVFLDTDCSTFSLDMAMKHDMLQTLQLFWKCLNISLKRSVALSEFILKRLCNSLVVNFYFKLLELPPLTTEGNSSPVIWLSPFFKRNLTFQFYESIFRFFNDLFNINQGGSFESFKQFLLIMLLKGVVRREKLARRTRPCCSSVFKNYSVSIIEGLKNSMFADGQSLFGLVRLCGDFNMIKDEKTTAGVSIVEKFLVTYELIKRVDEVDVNNRFFSSGQYLFEAKRKLKMYLLDDLYTLHKFEKNRLYMSFVRKEQVS